MQLKYFKELDGVRGLAALMVMWFHFFPDADPAVQPAVHLIHKVSVFGQTGVTLFFVLSGFLITRILFAARADQRYFRNFYIKRSLRIFPLYYLGLLIYFLCHPAIKVNANSWMYWVYLQNFANTFGWDAAGPQHYWSLAVEEHFYLFWPLIVYVVPQKHFYKAAGGLIALAFLCRVILINRGYGVYYFTFSVMDCLLIGALLAGMERDNFLAKIKFGWIALSGLVILIPAWLMFGAKGVDMVQIIKLPAIALIYAGLIGLLISQRTFLNKLFSATILRYTGKISYGLYVWHPICYIAYQSAFPGTSIWLNGIGSFATAYLATTISFYLFERHFLKMKKHFEPGSRADNQEMQLGDGAN